MDSCSGKLETELTALLDGRKTVELRKSIYALQEQMLQQEQLDLPIVNHFSHKIYGREMRMTKGMVVIGKIHKFEQLNILSKGDVTVVTDDGPIRVTAGFHLVAPPGAKRAFYAHEDSVWTVIHGTEETDVELIEQHFIAQSEQEYLDFLLEDKS